MKIYIQTNDHNQVVFMHYSPFDEAHGMHKTESELLQDGFLIDSIPTAISAENKVPVAYYTETDGYWYEYIDPPAGPATTSDIRSINAKLDYFMMMQEVI